MSIEKYCGVHATCMEYAPIIKKEGFKLSPDDRYLGPGVYFYDKNKNGDKFADIHKKNKLKHGCCKENDIGVIINATISSTNEKILNLEEEEYVRALESIKDDFWKEYDSIDMSHEDKEKRLNRRRTAYLFSLIPEVIESIDFIKVHLPYKRKKYSSGFVVYNTECISEICCQGVCNEL